jgi:hypothetical protein
MGAWGLLAAATTATTTAQTTTSVNLGTTGSTQPPLWIQAGPTLVGVLALLGAVYVAYRNSRAEHRRWLRQERLKAYSEFVDIAGTGLDEANELLDQYVEEGKGSSESIQLVADKTSNKLQRPMGNITLLGPEKVVAAAWQVRLSFLWSELLTKNLLKESDIKVRPDNQRSISLDLFESRVRERLKQLSGASFTALSEFKGLAASELQRQRSD